MSQIASKAARPIGWGSLFVGALLMGAFLASMTFSPPAVANVYQITTTAVDAGQIGVPYNYKFLGNAPGAGPNGGSNWRILEPQRTQLATWGLTMSPEGDLRGTATRMLRDYQFTVYSDSVNPAGGSDQRTFFLTIAGKLVYDSGPVHLANSDSPAVRPGQQNVPMFQFTLQALGEDIDVTRLVLYGLGTGSDTFDVANIFIWDDKNSNGRVDGLDQQIIPSSLFATTEGFLSSKVTFSFGSNILRIDSDVAGGRRCLLITYDFRNTVQAGRTFRLAFEKPTDIGYRTLTTEKTFPGELGGGADYTQNNSMILYWMPHTNFMAPYKGGIVTIYTGETPTQPTLYMNTTRDIAGPRLTRVGGETTALGLEFWTDSVYSIRLDAFTITDSGTGDAATQIEKAILYLDNDRNGVLNTGDQKIQDAIFVGDNATFNLLSPITFNTPLANRNDPNARFFVVTYKFRNNVPVTIPNNLTFQARITSGSNVTARRADLGGVLAALIAPDTPNLWGVPIAINLPVDTTLTGGTTSGPYPIRAIWYDIDTNHVASRGDTMLVTFDTNLVMAGAPTINDFSLPVLGDYLGNGATFHFMGGNRLRITLGDFARLTIHGNFSGATAEGAASGINLKDTTSGIASVHGLAAGPAVQMIDIESGAVSYLAPGLAGGGDTPVVGAPVGDKVCLIERIGSWRGLFPALRLARDRAFATPVGRFLARIYYWL